MSPDNPSATGRITPLSRQLTLWFLVLALSPLLVLSVYAYMQAEQGVQQSVYRNLAASIQRDREFVAHWFDYRKMDLKRLSESVYTKQLLSDGAYLGRDSETENDAVAALTNSADLQYQKLIASYDYIRDVLLVNKQKQVIYSAKNRARIGASLSDEEPVPGNLHAAVRGAYAISGASFSDLDRSNANLGSVTGFVASPVYGGGGSVIGVVAMHIDPYRLFDFLKPNSAESRYEYIVSPEGALRSPIPHSHKHETFDHERLKLTLQEVLKKRPAGQNQELVEVYGNEVPVSQYLGIDGETVIGVHLPLKVFDKKWVLVSEASRDAALLRTNQTVNLVVAAIVLVIGFVLAIAWVQARRVTKPLETLSHACERVLKGDMQTHAEVEVRNELGKFASTFNHMLDSLAEKEVALETSNQAAREAIYALNQQKFALDQHAIVAVTDVQGTITFANAKFEEISGYDIEELIGQNHRILKSGVHPDAFWREMYLTVSKGGVWHGEVCNRSKKGSLYWVHTTIVPFMRDGKPESYIAIRTDITMGKLAEQQLLEAKNAAEAGAQAKSDFLASMSHEIRTPMNGVLGMLNLLMKTQLDDEQKRQASLAYGSAEALLTIINDILDVSKIEAGKLELESMDFDIRELLSEFSETIAHRVQEKGLEFVVDLVRLEKSRVKGDPGRLRQILMNLVGNAIKFTEQGEIILQAALLLSYGGRLKLDCSIRDSGIGIPEDKVQSLFESFSQVDASTTRKYGGTGLGLTIVQQLCGLMGGSIQVTSHEGEGSTFSFSVYLENADEPAQALPETPDFDKARILVVDDHPLNQSVICEQIRAWGLDAAGASSVDEAVASLKQAHSSEQAFRVVLVDQHLGEGDADTIIARCNEGDPSEVPAFVAMPLASELLSASELIDSGYDALVRKPVTPSDLFDVLSKVLVGERPLLASVEQSEGQGDALGNLVLSNEIFSHARILLVEDNPVNQLVASSLLQQLGLSCDMAGNGIEAISALKQAPEDMPYHVILMDCQMPEMDGYETSRQIRSGAAGDQYRDISIIAMTANAMKGDRERCLEAGMSDYVSKPVNAEVLGEKLRDSLGELMHEVSAEDTHNEPEAAEQTSASAQEPDEIGQTPVLNREMALQNLGGNEDLFDALVGAAMEDIPNNLAQLEKAVSEQDFDLARLSAHSIKGVAASLGGERLSKVALIAETCARSEDSVGLAKASPKVADAFEALKAALVL